MDEYIDEAVEVSIDSGFGEAYDKEEAIYDDGIKQGMKQGIEQNKLEIAKKMLKEHENIEKIMLYVSLTKEEIEDIKNSCMK
jgi:predicted transposase/invertase (TIGR01784 family)